MICAPLMSMAGWKSVEEIDAYRLAVELRDDIGRLTETGRASKEFDFKDQIRESSASVTKNIAEGFERYYHGEFAHFVSIAKGSLGETIDALKEGEAKRYWAGEDFDRLHALAVKTRKATAGLLRYLQASGAPGEGSRRRTRKTRTSRV